MILRDIFAFVIGVVGIGCFTGVLTTWIKYRAKRVVNADVSTRLGEIADRLGEARQCRRFDVGGGRADFGRSALRDEAARRARHGGCSA